MSSIGGLSNSNAALMQQIGMRVIAKSQDVAKMQGEAAISLLEDAAKLQDSMTSSAAAAPVASVTGVGLNLDVTA